MAEFVFKVVSTILLGLLWLKCISSSAESNYEQCFIVGQQRICYLIGSKEHYSWNESHQICNSTHFSLPIFHNMDEQNTLGSYLKHLQLNGTTISAVWTPGKIRLLDDWSWVNGKKWSGFPEIMPPLNGTHVILTGKYANNLVTVDSSLQSFYLCQYYNEKCKEFTTTTTYVNLTTTCTEWRLELKTWYEARNYCLRTGGDLLDVSDLEDAVKLVNYVVNKFPEGIPGFKFWIGLRRISWTWHLEFPGIPEEVTFTNWFDDSQSLPSEELCIYVDASYNKWKTSSCNDTLSVVCQRREAITTINYGISTEIMLTSESESINYIALWSAIGVSVLLLACIGAIVITVVIAKRKISDANREAATDKQYQDLNKAGTSETHTYIDNYETIEDEHYDAIDDLLDDTNYDTICDANYLELVATDTNENVEDRHSDNNANLEE